MVLEFPFGLKKFRAFMVEDEEEKKRGTRRKEEEKKKKKKRRKKEEEKFKNLRYEFVWNSCGVRNFPTSFFVYM